MEEKTKARMLLVFFSDGPLERNDCDIGFFFYWFCYYRLLKNLFTLAIEKDRKKEKDYLLL